MLIKTLLNKVERLSFIYGNCQLAATDDCSMKYSKGHHQGHREVHRANK